MKKITKQLKNTLTIAGFILAISVTGVWETFAQTCSPPPANLVSWYKGDNNSFDTQRRNDGILQNGTVFDVGFVKQAFKLDGVDDRVKIPASASLNVGASGGLTIETWINPNNVTNDNKGAIAEYNNGTTIGTHLFINGVTPGAGGPGSVFANLSDINGTSHVISSPAGIVTVNQWQHIAVTYDKASGMASVYRNGVQVRQANLGTFTPQTTYDLYLGARIAGPFGTSYFDGRLDEVSLYNRALSASEIAAIVAAGTAGKCEAMPAPTRTRFDFDGDLRADLSFFRNGTWFINRSSTGAFFSTSFGNSSDELVAADYDGDGKTDLAVRSSDPSGDGKTVFRIMRSSDSTFVSQRFGRVGDNASVVGDWDGDGRDDYAVYRDGGAGGQSFFFYFPSSNTSGNPETNFVAIRWGTGGDLPRRGDFDGDGRQDAAVFRPSTNDWYILQSSNGQFRADRWGLSTDKFVQADYDGDGRTDLAVFRDGIWYIKQSLNNQPRYERFGFATDKLVPADYDGDGRTDVAVFRDGVWYLLRSTSGFAGFVFGTATDRPVPERF